mgnify:CR=1 FL=1
MVRIVKEFNKIKESDKNKEFDKMKEINNIKGLDNVEEFCKVKRSDELKEFNKVKVNESDKILKNEEYDDIDTLNYLIENIINKYNVRINMADIAGISKTDSRIDDIFIRYSYHNNCFCNNIKKNKVTFKLCVRSKNMLCKAFNKIKTPFYGRCYMGVNEFYYPVLFNEQPIALICVGQFTDNMEESVRFVKYKAERYGLDPETCVREYISITKEIDFSVSDLNKDVWCLCNYMSMYYRNKLLQDSIKAELSTAVRSTADYYQNKFIVSSAMNFIKTNYSNKISLDLIAKHCYCSPAYLSHLFKKETGISIIDYINECRISRAKHLLDITDLTVTQISSEVGFNDSSYFSKTFKKILGISPDHYRKRNF